MKVEEVIREVGDLQEKLTDVGDLSCEYPLYVETDGDWWSVMILGQSLVSSEDYEECLTLEFQIKEEMRDIQSYLNLVLKEGR